ncbi:hypothetical protein HS088_TW16G00139 [Tripterygium wilfordii]|uniref:Ubiquitin thioesterase OTU n=1 Tax=Tripterygium wilfordii TaxID=458696 RepID=A0A7J7CI34_TRIWF|nr:uncharacterized protein LOC119980237 [Tripterygium wilfordii]KAF5733699.1 hypothetical protein HS088_TW16G00139 [Tripterygium wilfordii]
MLGVLCARPKPWILSSLNLLHGSGTPSHYRLEQSPIHFLDSTSNRLRRHSSAACHLDGSVGGGAAAIWHVILPFSTRRRGSDLRRPVEPRGEGSWNVAWDARPARWLHRPDSAWLLFGVCACLAPLDLIDEYAETGGVVEEKIEGCELIKRTTTEEKGTCSDEKNDESVDYKVTGVIADGRCLFRAIVHGACLRSGEKAPDENQQRELADELRAQVVDELLKRREETEWFIEEDFDTYVKRIQQPYVWGGEPELMMASHVLKTLISVYMKDRTSGNLVNIANYGEEYRKDNEVPINVLFHGYGHYDIIETFSAKKLLNTNPVEVECC